MVDALVFHEQCIGMEWSFRSSGNADPLSAGRVCCVSRRALACVLLVNVMSQTSGTEVVLSLSHHHHPLRRTGLLEFTSNIHFTVEYVSVVLAGACVLCEDVGSDVFF